MLLVLGLIDVETFVKYVFQLGSTLTHVTNIMNALIFIYVFVYNMLI